MVQCRRRLVTPLQFKNEFPWVQPGSATIPRSSSIGSGSPGSYCIVHCAAAPLHSGELANQRMSQGPQESIAATPDSYSHLFRVPRGLHVYRSKYGMRGHSDLLVQRYPDLSLIGRQSPSVWQVQSALSCQCGLPPDLRSPHFGNVIRIPGSHCDRRSRSTRWPRRGHGCSDSCSGRRARQSKGSRTVPRMRRSAGLSRLSPAHRALSSGWSARRGSRRAVCAGDALPP